MKPPKARLHVHHRDPDGNGRTLVERWYCTLTVGDARSFTKLSHWYPTEKEAIDAAMMVARAVGISKFKVVGQDDDRSVIHVAQEVDK